jgi:hypothetical protein
MKSVRLRLRNTLSQPLAGPLQENTFELKADLSQTTAVPEWQNRTNTGVAPAQIEVFVRGLFAELFSGVCSSTEPCDEAQVNGTPIFIGEHCMCSCVHPLRAFPLNPLLTSKTWSFAWSTSQPPKVTIGKHATLSGEERE